MKFCHMADIHIRSNSRHEEYNSIFNELYKKLKDECVDHIIVAGDIAHTKTQQSPEFYDFTANFFESLAKIAKVHILLGNHDGNLLNPNRLDAITPIINALDNDNIKFYKSSDRIDMDDNYSLFAYSLFDKKGWNNWKIDSDRVNIALYHGCVGGAKTDQDYLLDAEIDIDEFKKYDFTFLGDIHLHQFLDDEKRVAYSGDLIQQNYGEDFEKGFLLWDIKDKNNWETKFVPLEPVHPFFTIKISDVDTFDIKDFDFIPKKSRIKLKFLNRFDSRSIDKIARDFKNYLNTKEIITVNEIKYDENIKIDSEIIKIDDLRNQQIQEKLICNYLEKLNVSNAHEKFILKLNEKYNSANSFDNKLARNIDWKIKHLNFSNMFAFKENNSINFEKLKGIVGIFGKNTIGKSSIIDVILYGIFNNNSKNITKNLDIINTRKDSCNVALDLEVNKIKYHVSRTTTKFVIGRRSNDEKKHARTDLNFYKIENNKKISLNGLQRFDTEKKIRSMFGTMDDFLTTCVSAQGDINNFISQGSTKRKEIIAKFLDLKVFDEKYKLAREDLKSLKSQLKMFKNKRYEKLIEKNKIKENELKSELNDKNLKKLELNETLKSDKELLDGINKQSQKFENYDYDEICNNILDYNVELKQHKTDIGQLIAKAENIVCELSILPTDNLDCRLQAITEKIEVIKQRSDELFSLQNEKDKTQIKLSQLQKSIGLLDNIPCGDSYPDCKFIKESYHDKEKINNVNLLMNEMNEQIKSFAEELTQLNEDKVNDLHKNTIRNIEKIKNLESDLKNITLEIKNEELQIINFKDRIENLKEKKFELELLGINNSDTIELKKKEKNIKEKILTTENDILENEKNRLDITKKLGGVQNSTRSLVNDYKKYKEILDKSYCYEIYTEIMSKNGIQQDIVRSKLSFINSEIDKLLRNIVKFKIELEEDEDHNNLNVFINYKDSGGRRLIETASGMEKAITSLAIRVALTQISGLPKPDIFIIDESFGTYDEQNLEAVSKMLQLLKQYFVTILVVTHVDAIKDCVDYILTIDRDQEKFSYLS
tara:strand:+ start:15088 stop:18240 length:3153 start_codon:yes stop_codon:yes gene_type:complete